MLKRYAPTETMVKIDNWSCVPVLDDPYKAPEQRGLALRGNVYGHPLKSIYDGALARTANIKEVCGRKIKTVNSWYKLGKIDPEYKKWLKKNYKDWDWRNPIKIF
ncbi:hypothetical protein DRO91_06060 [Candidatus Heimdallarchaeota archaeon]|nr:MAG: hypothetical protein DRO91_06060 [Candidatus Heimdallarchaeota archaeon]